MLFAAILIFINFSAYSQSVDKQKLIDQRALNSYSKQEIESMSEYKIYQVNYLYADSYSIPLRFKNEIDEHIINITNYSHLRKKNKKVKAYIKPETNSGPFIILDSQNEVREQLNRIKEQYD